MTTPSKKDMFNSGLSKFMEVLVVFNHDHPDVVFPTFHQGIGDHSALVYGYDQPKPIPDLEVTDEGIRATVSLSCTPTPTFIPWAAVVGMRGIGERTKVEAPKRNGLKLVPLD